MSFADFVFNCWSSTPTHQYELLSKKDENFAMDSVKSWKESCPVDPELTKLSSEKIKQYVILIINKLNEIPITSSNVPLIKEHLVEIGKQSDRVRCQLIERSWDIKTEKEWILLVTNALIFTYTSKI